MKLPRDLSGEDLAARIRKFGYGLTRQTGSHMRLSATIKGHEHHITIPKHKVLRIGTLAAILTELASQLEMDRQSLIQELLK